MSGPVASWPPARLRRPSKWWLALGAVVLVGVGVVAFVANGSAPTGGSPAARLRDWVQSTGLDGSLSTLRADDARITLIVRERRGTGAVRADCGVLYTDTEAANTELPAPDARTTTLLSDAYTEEGRAANACYDAGDTDQALLRRSAAERGQAEALLEEAERRIGSVTGGSASAPASASASTRSAVPAAVPATAVPVAPALPGVDG